MKKVLISFSFILISLVALAQRPTVGIPNGVYESYLNYLERIND